MAHASSSPSPPLAPTGTHWLVWPTQRRAVRQLVGLQRSALDALWQREGLGEGTGAGGQVAQLPRVPLRLRLGGQLLRRLWGRGQGQLLLRGRGLTGPWR